MKNDTKFLKDILTLNKSGFYPGSGDDFPIIWHQDHFSIENWILCDWPAHNDDEGHLAGACGRIKEKFKQSFCKENGYSTREVDYTIPLGGLMDYFWKLNGSQEPPYCKEIREGNEKRILFYEVNKTNAAGDKIKRNVWIFLGFEGLMAYRCLYVTAGLTCRLYLRKAGVGTKNSDERHCDGCTRYFLDTMGAKKPSTLVDVDHNWIPSLRSLKDDSIYKNHRFIKTLPDPSRHEVKLNGREEIWDIYNFKN